MSVLCVYVKCMHMAWAIALFVLVTSGNARAFRSGTSDKKFHAFFLCRNEKGYISDNPA